MPLYEYKCDKCGKTFEVMQKFSDEPLAVHPGCGGRVEKLISAPTFQFKGSGWYVTDYGRGGNGSSKKDSESKTASTESKPADSKPAGSKSSESKPAASEKSKSQ
ncbi:MAG TPA: zinc ribbon domain-containing protein [Bryobacteraceae bacterium]|nr:zinc ribbon domain-containing protein [Bryobacteraceae bacterium]